MFDSNVVIINIKDNNNPTYFYGKRSDINYGTKVYLCTTNNLGLENSHRISTNFSGFGYDWIELNALLNGSVYRYKLYNNNNKITSELINGSYTIYCSTYNITGASGSVGITETQYKTLMSGLYYNSGIIRIYGSEYGNGTLIYKTTRSTNAWDSLELLFLTCKYEVDTYNWYLKGTPQQAWFLVEIKKTKSTAVPPLEISWSSQTF